MIVPKVAICPICGKKTYLRIEDGGYLNEYPIRVHCMHCRALIRGIYVMSTSSDLRGLHLFNAKTEDCDVDTSSEKIRNADYVVDISGELPCKKVRVFDGNIIKSTPFLEAVDNVESIENRIRRLSYFTNNMEEWKIRKSTAFQLLDEGSIEFIAIALGNKMGEYLYQCDNYSKSLHCLQEVVFQETKYIFMEPNQDSCVTNLLNELSKIDKNLIHQFVERMGGIQEIILSYRKTIEIFSCFMGIYPNLLPAETFLRFKDKSNANIGIATCSFSDIKTFYQDAYESLLSLMYIPVCVDNIILRGNYQVFNDVFISIFKQKKFSEIADDYNRYLVLDNGMKLSKIKNSEPLQRMVGVPANRFLRNGIGHNNIKYDGITQMIKVFDTQNHDVVKLEKSLMDMAIDCLGLAKSAVLLSEIILFILRQELRSENINSIIHPRFYKGAEPNGKCPCRSNIKYKKCCKVEIERILSNITV